MGKDDRQFELIEDKGEILRDLFTYFPKLMNYLWESPKIVALIIQNTNTKDVKEYLAPFFANNFYENILSSSYIEDNLMYLLGELAGYKLEEKDRQKLQLLQEAAQVPDWERLKELIK